MIVCLKSWNRNPGGQRCRRGFAMRRLNFLQAGLAQVCAIEKRAESNVGIRCETRTRRDLNPLK